jgi:tRNA-2-methylthio-N6-dimethylallyladenosine synthase
MAPQLVYIKTFGCQMNEHDSENILNLLASFDYQPTPDPKKADLILINTCSVREKSEQKVYSLLGRLKRYKKNGRILLGVGGCVAQQEGDKLLKKAPYVDVVFGTSNIHLLPELIKTARHARKAQVATEFYGDSLCYPLSEPPKFFQVKAYVTIMEGCDNFCSFCVVPFVRSREKSRPSAQIIKEVRELVTAGVKEVTLLGQNVNSYGANVAGELSFSGLLKELNKIDKLERIRFTTSHPKDLCEELIACFEEQPKLCPHIHLPLQSGSDRILKMMNRGYTREDYLLKIKRLRTVCPEISITTDFIVGFPGETEKDFQATLDMVTEIEYDEFFSFKYSDRPKTQASQYPDKLPEEEKARRLSILQEKQKSITLKKNRTLIGKTLAVLVEGESKKNPLHLSGRSGTNKVVNFEGPLGLKGNIVLVKILSVHPHSLFGCLS